MLLVLLIVTFVDTGADQNIVEEGGNDVAELVHFISLFLVMVVVVVLLMLLQLLVLLLIVVVVASLGCSQYCCGQGLFLILLWTGVVPDIVVDSRGWSKYCCGHGLL